MEAVEVTGQVEPRPPVVARLRRAVRIEWSHLGRAGRWALFGLLASVAVAVTLGWAIPRQVEHQLLASRAAALERVAGDIAQTSLAELNLADRDAVDRLQEEVRLRLLGTDAVRVKLWSQDGTIVFSDVDALIGENFGFPPAVARAFAGQTVIEVPDPRLEERAAGDDLEGLIEFHLPVTLGASRPAVLEVYERTDSLTATVDAVRRTVWVAIGSGLGLLALFTTVLFLVNASLLERRRAQTEQLLGQLLTAQDDERRRIVGSLHDDVGQPLYRVMYGLDSLPGDEAARRGEVAKLREILREVDRTLRAELRLLHEAGIEERDLATAVGELAELTAVESGLAVDTVFDDVGELAPPVRSALFLAVREALVNVRKHAGADHVTVTLLARRGRVVARVEDDGTGYRGGRGLGLSTTRERLAAIGGGLDVRRTTEGTRFEAWVPSGAS